MSHRIVIVDDHAIVRTGIAQLFAEREDYEVVGQAGNAAEALRLVAKLKPQVVITDISLEVGMNGIELVKHLRADDPDLVIIVLSMHDEDLYAERALAAGANGYLVKRCTLDRLFDVLRRALAGQVVASPEMQRRLAQRAGERLKGIPTTRLSDRELEVLELLGRGLGTREIAETLRLSIKTIETYRGHLKVKLDLESAPQLMRYAVRWVEQLAR